MIEEELPDELENDLDDIEPVGDESQLYEHFRVVVDKGQAMVRVDKYLFERIVNASRNRIQKAAEDGFVMANGKPGLRDCDCGDWRVSADFRCCRRLHGCCGRADVAAEMIWMT